MFIRNAGAGKGGIVAKRPSEGFSDGLCLGRVDNQPCGGVFGKNPRLPRQKCSQGVQPCCAFFPCIRVFFTQKTVSQAECQHTLGVLVKQPARVPSSLSDNFILKKDEYDELPPFLWTNRFFPVFSKIGRRENRSDKAAVSAGQSGMFFRRPAVTVDKTPFANRKGGESEQPVKNSGTIAKIYKYPAADIVFFAVSCGEKPRKDTLCCREPWPNPSAPPASACIRASA